MEINLQFWDEEKKEVAILPKIKGGTNQATSDMPRYFLLQFEKKLGD